MKKIKEILSLGRKLSPPVREPFSLAEAIMEQLKKSQAENTELRAALGVMLSSWDGATEKLVDFMKDGSKENSEAYMAKMQPMFDAAVAARTIYMRPRI